MCVVNEKPKAGGQIYHSFSYARICTSIFHILLMFLTTFISFFLCVKDGRFIFHFRDTPSTREDLHREMLATLITGYFGKDIRTCKYYQKWKVHFRKFCPDPNRVFCSIYEDFQYLEEKGELDIEKYDALETIFSSVDKRAVQYIEDMSKQIKNTRNDEK